MSSTTKLASPSQFLVTSYDAGMRINREVRAAAEVSGEAESTPSEKPPAKGFSFWKTAPEPKDVTVEAPTRTYRVRDFEL